MFCLIAAGSLWAAEKKELDINANQVWTDTGIDLKPGDTVTITATGTIQIDATRTSGPEGVARGWADLVMQYPVTNSGRGALIGRFTDNPAARAFLVGPRSQRTAPVAGHLFLGINEQAGMMGTGNFHATVEWTKSTAKASTAAAHLPVLTQQMIDSIPPRVSDAQNNLGDRVNFIIVGSQEKVQAALAAAGWVLVDKTKKDAVLHGLLTSLSKEGYVTMPMSELMLFGRVQDFGYAQSDPLKVVASRHHFRIWKAPFTVGGEEVWAGAGTHDIGFDRDNRNNGITHKIDPATDGEREYIGQGLQDTGMAVKEEYITATNTVKDAKTATGSGFTSDGRTLVIYLEPSGKDYAGSFASTFCAVLAQNNPDGGTWDGCAKYLDGADTVRPVAMMPLTAQYHVVIVPGFLSSCFSDAPAFSKGQALHDKYGYPVDLIPVPNDPSSANAKMIAQFLQTQVTDGKKIILIGYSKGAPDIYETLATNPELAKRVAAFVSVAGAVGGSPIAGALPAQADKWIKQFTMKGCQGDIDSGFKSLAREARQQFLASYPRLDVPTYSIIAASNRATTSKSLLESWIMLGSYGSGEDGQLLKEDAILPEARFLGTAIADHFAIALPFESSGQKVFASEMDKNHYPRAALLEAIVRYVTDDLKGQ